MADYFVASGGSNDGTTSGGTNAYGTWAKAATSLQTALAAATANGDRVIIQYNAVPSGDAELAADTSYAPPGSRYVQILSASNDGGSAFTLTPMGSANWIGNSTTNRSINFCNGIDGRIYAHGLTLRTAGSTLDTIVLASGAGTSLVFDSGYLWMGNTANGVALTAGNNSGGQNDVTVKNTTLRFGATGNTLASNTGRLRFENCAISSDGSAPATLISNGILSFIGCDLSLVTGTLVGNIAAATSYVFQQCKLGAGVTVLATQTLNPTASAPTALVIDCASDDTHGLFGYYDALGSVVSDTGITYTGGAAGQSWKIVTTANATFANPFQTPWISLYNASTSAITPRFEVLRDGNANAFNNNELWANFLVKTTNGSTAASFSTDRMAILGSPNPQANGTDTWDGENATHWAGKVDSGSPVTPAEAGDIRGRVCFGVPSEVAYFEPFIRF